MLKIHCDICKSHLDRDYVANRLAIETGPIVFSVSAGVYHLNRGNLCGKCLIEAIRNSISYDKNNLVITNLEKQKQ